MKLEEFLTSTYRVNLILSLGGDCRPAAALKRNNLRYFSSPYDWMMNYSLKTVLVNFKNNFADFFTTFRVYARLSSTGTYGLEDLTSGMKSIHAIKLSENLDTAYPIFLGKMRKRFERLKFLLKSAHRFSIISSRMGQNDEICNFISEFEKIVNKEFIYINIEHSSTEHVTQEYINKSLYINIKFDDTHPHGNKESGNKLYWLGNIAMWDKVCNIFHLEKIYIPNWDYDNKDNATDMNSPDKKADLESMAELRAENKFLFAQLKLVQDELEKYYQTIQQYEADNSSGNAELTRQAASYKVAKDAYERRLPALRALISWDGAISGIQAVPHGVKGCVKIILSGGYAKNPTSHLGGNEYHNVINAYDKGGIQAIYKLLASRPHTPAIWANAFTAVAKHVRSKDCRACMELARLAWQSDPKPYRLKWLVFRTFDAGDASGAAALLDLLPTDMKLTSTEQNRIRLIRQKADAEKEIDASKISESSVSPASGDIEFRSLKNNNDTLKRDLERLRASNKIEKDDLQKKINILLENSEKHELENLKLSDQNKKNAELLTGLQKDNELLQGRTARLKNENMRLWGELKDRAGQAENAERNLAAMRAERKALSSELENLKNEYQNLLRSYNSELRIANDTQNRELNNICRQFQEIGSSLSAWSEHLDSKFREMITTHERQLYNSRQQYAAYSGLVGYFQGKDFPPSSIWRTDWPASPDYILELVKQLDQNDFDLVVEFGSGITTLFTARTIAHLQKNKPERKVPKILSFDHMEEYKNQTESMLAKENLASLVDLNYAPLVEYAAPDGVIWNYYKCSEKLEDYSAKYKNPHSRILVIVDGPPGGTGKNARYPAFPVIMRYFYPANIKFLLDDYNRKDEQELGNKWIAACQTGGLDCFWEEKNLEKGALLLNIKSYAGT